MNERYVTLNVSTQAGMELLNEFLSTRQVDLVAAMNILKRRLKM